MATKRAAKTKAPNVLLLKSKKHSKATPATAAAPPPETARPGDVVFTSLNGGAPHYYMAGGWWWRWTGSAWSNALELTLLSDPEMQDLAVTRRKRLKKLGYL